MHSSGLMWFMLLLLLFCFVLVCFFFVFSGSCGGVLFLCFIYFIFWRGGGWGQVNLEILVQLQVTLER